MTPESLSDVMPVQQHASFADTVYEAWLNGVECEAYSFVFRRWQPCFIREIDINDRGIVNYVVVVYKNSEYERRMLNDGTLSRDLHIPPVGKTVDGSVVVIDGKKLLGEAKS